MRIRHLIQIFLVFNLISVPITAWAASLTLRWQGNTEPDISGYNVYFGAESRNYGLPVPVGNVRQHTINNLQDGVRYYFALTAVDTSGNESGYSSELSIIAEDTSESPPDTGASPSIHNVKSDFNGDGQNDIFWHNVKTGATAIWLMNNGSISQVVKLPPVKDKNWRVSALGDFNGDQNTDILWRNIKNGQNLVWVMNGTSLLDTSYLQSQSNLDWTIRGSGDFNNDGQLDILWRNLKSGEVSIWEMNGLTLVRQTVLKNSTGLSWKIGGTGDFNGDGNCDILWRNSSTGSSCLWVMNGKSIDSLVWLQSTSAKSDWVITGSGDLNSNGSCDILWRNIKTGQNLIWFMSADVYTSRSFLTNTDKAWSSHM